MVDYDRSENSFEQSSRFDKLLTIARLAQLLSGEDDPRVLDDIILRFNDEDDEVPKACLDQRYIRVDSTGSIIQTTYTSLFALKEGYYDPDIPVKAEDFDGMPYHSEVETITFTPNGASVDLNLLSGVTVSNSREEFSKLSIKYKMLTTLLYRTICRYIKECLDRNVLPSEEFQSLIKQFSEILSNELIEAARLGRIKSFCEKAACGLTYLDELVPAVHVERRTVLAANGVVHFEHSSVQQALELSEQDASDFLELCSSIQLGELAQEDEDFMTMLSSKVDADKLLQEFIAPLYEDSPNTWGQMRALSINAATLHCAFHSYLKDPHHESEGSVDVVSGDSFTPRIEMILFMLDLLG